MTTAEAIIEAYRYAADRIESAAINIEPITGNDRDDKKVRRELWAIRCNLLKAAKVMAKGAESKVKTRP